MNLKKRILPMIMVFLMILVSFPVSTVLADATTTGTLTMKDATGTNTKASSKYVAYRIASFDFSTLNNKTVYTNMVLNNDYKLAITNSLSIDKDTSDKDIFTKLSGLDPTKTAKLAADLKGVVANSKDTYSSTNGMISGMPYGYYLVIETENNANDGTVISNPMLVCIPGSNGDPNVILCVKPAKADIQKKIVDGGKLYDTSTAAVGDIISYQSLSSIPTYPDNATGIIYKVTDTCSSGLTINKEIKAKVVKLDGSEVELELTKDYTLAQTNNSFILTLIDDTKIKNWGKEAGNKLLITYSATLNGDNIKYGITGYPNSVNLTCSTDSNNTYTTPDDTVITYTTNLTINKTDGTKPLGGAIFKLYKLNKNSGVYEVVGAAGKQEIKTDDSTGKAFFNQLQQGEYQLEEIKAPDGYNKLSKKIDFTVSALNGIKGIPDQSIFVTQSGNTDALAFKAEWKSGNNDVKVASDGALSIDILNTEGFTLPGTGGIGTTIFTVSGIIIIALGCCMIFVYMKKSKASKQHNIG